MRSPKSPLYRVQGTLFTQHFVRYEVQDPEPDEAGGHGTTYKASANALIPIPKDSTGLPQYPVGKQVLARYPETTTFYRAEVMGTKVSYLSRGPLRE